MIRFLPALLIVPALPLVAALPAQAELDRRIDQAISRGCRYLMEKQQDDGTMGYDYPRMGAHALCMLALLHSGVAKDSPVILKGLRPLRGPTRETYDAAVRLMVIDLLREPALRKTAREDARLLIDAQNARGGWTYRTAGRGDPYDNSNTQYAILGLRAAEKMGHLVPRKTWRLALNHVLAQQRRDGGVGYTLRGESSPSMTAGALSSLVVTLARCEYAASDKHRQRAEKSIKRQLKYLERHWRPSYGGHSFYTMYGLERAMAFAGSEKLGNRNWYEEGAKFLVDKQQADGSWQRNPVATAFALLFLNRPTKPTARETPGDISTVMGRLDKQSRPRDVQEAVRHIVKRGRPVGTLLVHYLENPVAAVREAAALSLRQLYKRRLGYDPARPPRTNAAAIAKWRKLVRG